MKKAFSLVELLVVVAIIAILAGVLVSSFSGGTESARAARCLSNLPAERRLWSLPLTAERQTTV